MRPHIYFKNGSWCCKCKMIKASGCKSPAAAYQAWNDYMLDYKAFSRAVA